MKKSLLFLFMVCVGTSFAQNIQINEVNVSPIDNGLNVNLKTISFNGAGFLSSSYTVTDNVINLDACFWFNATLPVLTFVNDFQIPLENAGDYTVNITVHNSSSNESCDYYSVGDTYTTEFLSVDQPGNSDGKFTISPNPTTGIINLNTKSILNLSVYDVAGRLVKSKQNPGSEMNLQDLPNGVYLVKAQLEKGIATSKVILAK